METTLLKTPCLQYFQSFEKLRHGYHGNGNINCKNKADFYLSASYLCPIPKIFKICDMSCRGPIEIFWSLQRISINKQKKKKKKKNNAIGYLYPH